MAHVWHDQGMDIRTRDVDPELHRCFKMTCLANGETMENVIKQLLAEYVKREGKVPYDGGGRKATRQDTRR